MKKSCNGLLRLSGDFSTPGPVIHLSLNMNNVILFQANSPADYTLQFIAALGTTTSSIAAPQPTLLSNAYCHMNIISGNAGFYRLVL